MRKLGKFVFGSGARDAEHVNRAHDVRHDVVVERHYPQQQRPAADPNLKPIQRRPNRTLSDSALARALAEEDNIDAVQVVATHYGERGGSGSGGRLQLTDSALARQLAAEDDFEGAATNGDSSGITVRCPYLGCMRSVAMEGFIDHANNYHTHASDHKYACPICTLASGTHYSVHDGTNLLTHLQAVHPDGGHAVAVASGAGGGGGDGVQVDVDNLSYEELLALEERMGSVAIAPSSVTVDQLPTHPFSSAQLRRRADEQVDEELTTCTICLVEYEDGEMLKTLPCLHSYHQECIDSWLGGHKLCPICKFDVTSSPSTYL